MGSKCLCWTEGSGSRQQQCAALGRHPWQIILLVPFYHLLRNSASLHRAPGLCLHREEMGVGQASEHAAIYKVPLNFFIHSVTVLQKADGLSWWTFQGSAPLTVM